MLARQFRLAPFNAYRRRWKLHPYKSFFEMTGGDVGLAEELSCLYQDRDGVAGVDRVEFSVGLFAETRQKKKSVLPTLLSLMVASDAFSHALTNPLLAAYVFGEGALTEYGLLELERVDCLSQIAKDNCTPGVRPPLTSFGLPA
jgi:prostaglandin-endoperoxide synthase 2